MTRRPGVLALVFAVAFIALFLAPPFLPFRFPLYGLINWADVVDLLTPLILVPLYWLLLVEFMPRPTKGWAVVFLVFAAAWVDAHGIHLAANAIGHLLKDQPGPARDLTEFWDERFGHYLWHTAALALSALVLFAGARSPEVRTDARWPGIVAALVYGFALFLIGDEAGTAPLMLTFGAAFIVAAWSIRKRILASPILTMFGAGYALMIVLFAIWFVVWGGRLPQFSDLGLIK
jgi:hypothetical protein